MEKTADLHIHTSMSDGTFSPAQAVEYAKKLGFFCVAVTDHDTVDGVRPAQKKGLQVGIEVIGGVEFTAQEKGKEVHILGFFPDLSDKKFLNKLKTIRRSRIDRIYKMTEKLKKYNVIIDPQDVFKLSKEGAVGRPHLATVIKDKGYVLSVNEAFRRYIGDSGPCYVEHYEMSVAEAISELKRIGAVVVFAHPAIMGGEDLIPKFIRYGLDGIEAYHSEQSSAVSKRLVKIASQYRLLVTGGSDCHGLNKGEALMGKVRVAYKFVEDLKECARRMRNT